MIQDRVNLHTFSRRYLASQMHGSQEWFEARVRVPDNDNDIDASNLLPLRTASVSSPLSPTASPLPPSTPSFGDIKLACANGCAAIMDLIEHPLSVGFPTLVR